MNRRKEETRSYGASVDDGGETPSIGAGLPVSLRRSVISYAVTHHMTPDEVLAEGARLLLGRERKRIGPKTKPRPANKPFDAEERQYLCGLDAVDECGEKRITWNRYFIRYVEHALELGARPTDVFRSAGVGPEIIGQKRIERCAARWRRKAKEKRDVEHAE